MVGLRDHGKEVSKCEAKSPGQSPAAGCRDDRGARAEAERPGGRVLLITQVRKKRQGNSESSGLGNRKKGDSTD